MGGKASLPKIGISSVLMLNSAWSSLQCITVGLTIQPLCHLENCSLFPTHMSAGGPALMLNPFINRVLGVGLDLSVLPKLSQWDPNLGFCNWDIEYNHTMYSKCQFPSQFIVFYLKSMCKWIFSCLFLYCPHSRYVMVLTVLYHNISSFSIRKLYITAHHPLSARLQSPQ